MAEQGKEEGRQSVSTVRVHQPIPGCHIWGIEYNYELDQRVSYEADANEFVHAMYECLHHYPSGYWFHQCGCTPDSRRHGYHGYQFFECWAPNAEKVCQEAAKFVATRIGCGISISER